MVKKIYIDTSIVGGYFDKEFKEVTRSLFHRLISREIIFVISDLLELELKEALKMFSGYFSNFLMIVLKELSLLVKPFHLQINMLKRKWLEKLVLRIAAILLLLLLTK